MCSVPYLPFGGVELLAVQPDVVVGAGLRRQQVRQLVRQLVRIPVLWPVLPRRLRSIEAHAAFGTRRHQVQKELQSAGWPTAPHTCNLSVRYPSAARTIAAATLADLLHAAANWG